MFDLQIKKLIKINLNTYFQKGTRRILMLLLIALSFFSSNLFLPPPVHASVVSATLTSSADADITKRAGYEANNSGIKTDMRIGSRTARDERIVTRFDLSSVPAGATIEAANLSLYVTRLRDGARTYNVHRITGSWLEGTGNKILNSLTINGITWWERQYGDNIWTGTGLWDWAAVGGDFIAVPSASLSTLPVIGARMSWSLTADVQAFVSGTATNYGWLLKDSVEGSAVRTQVGFATKEDVTPANWPQLIVTYVIGSTTVTPTNVNANASTPFTLTMTNTAGVSGDQIHQVTFTVPTGYTNIPTTAGGYTITAPGAKNWTVTGLPAGANGPQTVTLTATTAVDDLANTENLQVGFTATAPSTSGVTSWDSSLVGAAGGIYYPPAQTVNVIDGVAPDTVITSPLSGTLSGSNQLITGGATDNVAVSAIDIAISRNADSLYWNGAGWVAGLVWNAATITSGSGTPSANWQYNWTLPTDDGGGFTIQTRAIDASANVDPTPANVSISVDNTAPQINSFMINNNNTYTNTSTVTLSNNTTGAAQMRFAETTVTLAAATYASYNSTSALTLSGGDGQKTVYAQYRDLVGNETTPAVAGSFDNIIYDATAPSIGFTDPSAGQKEVSISPIVLVRFFDANGVDPATINTSNFYLQDSSGTVTTATVAFNSISQIARLTPSSILSYDTTYTAYITMGVSDMAGNPFAANYSWSFVTGAEKHLTIQSSWSDTYLNENLPSGNYGTSSNLRVASAVGANERSIIKFDLATLPANIDFIEEGTLRLYMNSAPAGSRNYQTRALTSSWTEGGATWNSRDGVSTWTTPGGDLAAASDTTATGTSGQRFLRWNIISDIRSWYASPALNYGIAIADAIENNTGTAVFYSQNYTGDTNLAPLLDIGYLATTATISPLSLYQGENRQFTITAGNDGDANASPIFKVHIDIPAGYTNIPTSAAGYTVVASNGGLWEVSQVPAGSSGPQEVIVRSISKELGPGDSVQIAFNATAPLTAGATSWQVRPEDADTDIVSHSLNVNVQADTTLPTSSITSPISGSTTTNTVTITGAASDLESGLSRVDLRVYDPSTGLYWNGAGWQAVEAWNQTTGTGAWNYIWAVPATDKHAYQITARATDNAANLEAPLTAQITLYVDNIGPSSPVVQIANGAALTNTNSVTLTSISAVDSATVSSMRFSDSGTLWSAWESYSATRTAWDLTASAFGGTAADGTKTVSAQFKDLNGNLSGIAVDTIVLDKTAPQTATVTPTNNAINVPQDTTVSVVFTETNGMDAATINTNNFYLLDNNNATVTASVSYDPAAKKAVLTPQNLLINGVTYGAHLTGAIKDSAGNSLAPYSWNFTDADQIVPDTVITDPSGGTLTGSTKIITGSATDNADVATVTISIQRQADLLFWNGSTWTTGPVWNNAVITSGQNMPSAAWQYAWALPSDNGGSYIIQAQAIDGANNNDPTPASVSVMVDNTAPQALSLKINNDATYTINNAVTLNTSVTEASEMRFAETTAALAAATYISYNTTAIFSLSSSDGTKTVYAQYRDTAGNATVPGAVNTTDTIKLDATAPLVNTVSPANGSNAAGPFTTITASFTEANSMDAATINSTTYYLLDGNSAVVTTTIGYDPVNKTATLTPSSSLTQGMTYTANVTTGVKDSAGNPMTVPYSWTFTIADSTPPDTVITDPSGGTLTVSPKIVTGGATDNVAVSSVAVAVTRDADGYYWDGAGSTWTAGPVWNSAVITSGQNTPSAAWQYSWVLPTGDGGGFNIQARAGDSGSNNDPTPVVVAVTVDNTAPIISNFTINSGAAYATTASVTLNSSVTGATQMRFAETTAALAAAAYISYNTTATFSLSSSDGTKTVYAQYRDAAGNATIIGTPGSSDGIILDLTKPIVAATFPANGAVNVNVADIITVTFTEANQMDVATINDISFYLKDPGNTTVTAGVTYNSAAKIASLTPVSALSFATTYTAHLTMTVADLAGNTLVSEKIWSFKTSPPSTHPPGAPLSLSVTAGDMVDSISWTAPAPGSDIGGDFDPLNNKGGYDVYRSTLPSGPWTKLNGAAVLIPLYFDLSFGVKGYYYYMVRAVDLGGSESADSSVIFNRDVDMSEKDSDSSMTTLDAANGLITLNIPAQSAVTTITAQTLTTSPPAGITPITNVFDLGPGGTNFPAPLTLTFKTPGDPTGAKIRYWDGANWREVSGGNYIYDVPNRMVSYDNITHFSYYTVTNNSDSTPPSAPATLTVSAPADGQLKLDWGPASDPESGISGYIIYRSLSIFDNSTKGSLARVIATPGNVLTYTDNNLIKGETYYYGVAAENGAGLEGTISNVTSETVTGKENAHKNYSTNTNLCRDCHKLHEAPSTVKKLLRKAPEIENCYVCHDGTGSDYNVRSTFENKAAHDTSMTVSTGGVATKCTECHSPHGIGNTWATRLAEENLCYKCHNSTTSSANGWNIEQQFAQASRHSITTTTADGLTGSVLECTSCHGPHGNKAGSGITDITARLSDPFNTYNLWGGNYSDFCVSCHRGSGWPETTATISSFVPYSITFPIVTAYQFFPGWDKSAYTGSPAGHSANYTCQTCHSPHGSPNQRLTAYFDGLTYDTSASVSKEENLCYQCHKIGGPAGAKDLLSQFAKASRHPVETTETHSDLDTTATLGDGSRHAECVDCHDVHKAKAGTHTKGTNAVSGVLNGIIGVAVTNGSAGTTPTYSPTAISFEYELCFKCHSAYINLPFGAKDKAVEFNFNNPSFHPVESTGTNSGISSGAFVGAWSSTSKMYCSDCHTTNDAVSTTTPAGPHGSTFGPILKAEFSKYDGNGGGNDICYECHSYSVYFGSSAATRFWDDTTTTSEHKTHIGDRKAPCYACHDTHGRSDNAHLIRIKESGETTGTTSFTHNSGGGACQATCHTSPLVDYTYKHKY